MVQKYYNVKQAAEILGLSEEEVRDMTQRRELYGYRDGSDWKFKIEDIDKRAAEQAPSDEPESAADDQGDVLLSELELGESDPGASGTVIGMDAADALGADSDLSLIESDVNLGGSDLSLAESDVNLGGSDLSLVESDVNLGGSDLSLVESDVNLESAKDSVDDTVAQFEDLDLNIEDSQFPTTGDSTIDLGADDLDDDDLVIGGSSTGSDVTVGGDSGISLINPADSGLSLEAPLDLSGSSESLELGEDEILGVADDAGVEEEVEEIAELETEEDDFMLTPLEEAGDDESDSGSQVIALDGDALEGVEGPALTEGLAAGLDDGGEVSFDEVGLGTPADDQAGLAEGAPAAQVGAIALSEAPYSALNIVSLAACTLFISLSGMMVFDLLRNMWSWEQASPINSAIMDLILGLFG